MSTSSLSHQDYLNIDRDYASAARVADLLYVSDTQPGIQRIKAGTGWRYVFKDKEVSDDEQLLRIKKLAIPPAWENVWICAKANGHIQATGFDVRKRKQYRYHTLWHTLRHETKFHRMYEFGKRLPKLRLRIERDIQLPELPQDKVIALVISLMERTYIRIGNSGYEKLYGSYGLTTMKDQHVKVNGKKVSFEFTGKKGINHKISLQNRRLAKVIQACRDIPGKELFQYFNEQGERRSIDSGMVNSYLKETMEMDFTAKDFRTWAGSLNILWAFKSIGEAITGSDRKKKVNEALTIVSEKLGNTRTVCRKYYVHPHIIELYEEDNLQHYLKGLDDIEQPDEITGLTTAESILMKILKGLQSKE
jgi:DNA topoisomerase I